MWEASTEAWSRALLTLGLRTLGLLEGSKCEQETCGAAGHSGEWCIGDTPTLQGTPGGVLGSDPCPAIPSEGPPPVLANGAGLCLPLHCTPTPRSLG